MFGLAAILFTQLSLMSRTNFTGFDEWVIIDLVSRGIIDVPHANRPVHLLWHLPAALFRYSLTPYVVLHGIYSFLSGALVFLLLRRMVPGQPLLWMLAAIFSLVWGPSDLARLSTIERTGYAAFTFAMLFAIWLLVESWRRDDTSMLALSALMGFLVARAFEAVVPLLLFSPLLLVRMPSKGKPRLRLWLAVWEGVLGLAILLVVVPAFFSSGQIAYQLQVLGLDWNPLRVAQRLARQYYFHLAPLVTGSSSELWKRAVAIAVAVYLAVVAIWAWLVCPATDGAEGAARHVKAMAAGLAWACLGYGVLVLTPSQPTALRMQFLSAPGIGLFLASLVCLPGVWLRGRSRRLAATLLGAWVVAVGTGRSVTLQSIWDAGSVYPAQMRMLTGLTQQVPDVRRHTMIVLLDQGGAWAAGFGFRHALLYLYEGRAIGYVHGAWDALYPAHFGPAGITVEPLPALRGPWEASPTLHLYSELVVVRFTPDGAVEVLPDWPSELPPLPRGARYDPMARIITGGPALPERAMLTQ